MTDDETENSALNDDTEPDAEPDEREPKKSSETILRAEVEEGLAALRRETGRLLCSGFSAGMDLGFSLLLMAIVTHSATDVLPHPVVELLVATMYSFGFLIVVIGRSELFTEQTSLAVLPWLSGHTTLAVVGRLWGLVYVSNLAGGAVVAVLVTTTAPALGIVDVAVFATIAKHVVDHPGWVILMSGVLAGWLMGLLSWLVAAGRDTISQIVIVGLITSAIGLAHLHHAILGTIEVLAGMFVGRISLEEFGHFLFWATLGNTIGGVVFVALLKFGHARPIERDID